MPRVVTSTIVMTIVLAFVASALMAQATTRFGVKAGVSFANFRSDDITVTDTRAGFSGGAFASVPLNEFLSFQPEVLFTSRGAKKEIVDLADRLSWDYRFHYVEVPLLLRVYGKAGDNMLISGLVGPSVAFRTQAEFTLTMTGSATYEIANAKDVVLDMVIGLGAGIEAGKTLVGLEIRYHPGLESFLGDPEPVDSTKVNFVDSVTGKPLDLKHTAVSILATFSF
jgi:hypothetical protein